MARVAKYTDPHNIMVTKTTADLVEEVAKLVQTDKAPVGRTATDLLFDLEDGELKNGDTFDEAVQRAITRMADAGVIKRPAAAPAEAIL
jgi:hypothetical protein